MLNGAVSLYLSDICHWMPAGGFVGIGSACARMQVTIRSPLEERSLSSVQNKWSTPMPEVCGTIAPQVGVLYSIRGDEIPIYKVTLELHVNPEGLRALQESNAELCISDEPVSCGDGKWAQNGRIVDSSPLRALLDAAELYCTVWHGRLRRARSHPSLKALRGGRS